MRALHRVQRPPICAYAGRLAPLHAAAASGLAGLRIRVLVGFVVVLVDVVVGVVVVCCEGFMCELSLPM